MKTMLIASSALTLLAAPALAQDPAQQTGDPAAQQPGAADQRDDGMFDWFDDGHPLEGTPVYTSDGERVGSVERVRGGAGPQGHTGLQADQTADLDAEGLVVETGGFLGIGTREVEIDPGQAERTTVDGDERIVLDMSNAEFERLPEHDRNDRGFDDQTRDQRDRDRDPGAAGIQQNGQDDAMRRDRADRQDGDVFAGDWFDDGHPLEGAPVYTNDGERVGSVERVRGGAGPDAHAELDADGRADLDADGLVVETGGFLGIGTREVRIEAGQAERATVDGDERIILDMSHDEFERQPEHDRGDGSMNDQNGLDDGPAGTRGRDAGIQQDRTAASPQADAGDAGTSHPGASGQPRPETTERNGLDPDRDTRADASGEVHGDVYTDGHHWVGTPVYTSDGERVGSVEKVRSLSDVAYDDGGDTVAMTEAEPELDALIVETGGFLGIGTREVEIDPGQVELEMVDGDERLVLDIDAQAFRDLPEHRDRSDRDRRGADW